MQDEPSNPLMQRVMRFINYNSELYIRHRRHGEYNHAVARLERLSRLVGVVDQAEREGRCQLSWNDWATIKLARSHVGMILGRAMVPDEVLDSVAPILQYA